MVDTERDYKEGHSVVWDEAHRFREQNWSQLKQRIENTQGGIGVAADDFLEMLRYRGAPFGSKTNTLRDAFADLTRGATDPDDLDLLSDILAYMLRDPWSANIDAAWFIYYLEEEMSRNIDLVRAAAVINRLYDKNSYAALVLCETLSYFVYGKDDELVFDQVLNTGRLSADLVEALKGVHLSPPRAGERSLISYPSVFVSYSRFDLELMRKVRSQLRSDGFRTWADENLEPGTPEWEAAIEKAIKDSGAMVVILTPRTVDSVWVRREIQYALMLSKRLFPLLAEGDESSAVPITLATTQRVDIRIEYHAGMATLASALRRYFVALERPPAEDAVSRRDIAGSAS